MYCYTKCTAVGIVSNFPLHASKLVPCSARLGHAFCCGELREMELPVGISFLHLTTGLNGSDSLLHIRQREGEWKLVNEGTAQSASSYYCASQEIYGPKINTHTETHVSL